MKEQIFKKTENNFRGSKFISAPFLCLYFFKKTPLIKSYIASPDVKVIPF